jgi:lysozyme family protein
MSFAACLPVILASEGGYAVDQGGPTNHGVTQAALSTWLRRPATIAEVQALTPASVAPLYQANFYNAAHCPDCPTGLDLMVFDEAVNEGVGRAIQHLQAAVGVTVDGLYGPATQAAVEACDPIAAIHHIHDTNAAFYQSLDAKYPQDEGGWQARNDRTRDLALAMAQAALATGAPVPADP